MMINSRAAGSQGRRLHFVGTLPQFDTAAAAFAAQTGQLHGEIRRLSGGETGPRLSWFVPLVKELKAGPKVTARQEGDWSDYDDVDRLAVRRGHRLTPGDIPLHLAEWAEEELDALQAAGTPATAERPLQVGVPSYLDLALFIFGPIGALRWAGVFLDAVTAQVERMVAHAGNRVVIQIETPAAAIAVASMPSSLQRRAADALGGLVLRQVRRAPQGARLGMHLCVGDMGHKARVRPSSVAPLVRLTNVLARRWPDGRTLEFVHIPLCGGEEPPTTDPTFYAPLRELDIAPNTTLVAGLAHEGATVEDQRAVRDLVERETGMEVDIATACGLGRRSREQAESAVERMRALLS